MACRKNAYRGMVELSEYLEKQNEEATRQQNAFEEEQRKIWTPPSVLERCCLQWLSHGPHQIIRQGGNLASVASRGCSGGCSNSHPKVTLEYIVNEGVATATVSHALDPFIQFFRDMPEATEIEPLRYQLTGLLSNHHDKLKQKFGAHLVSIDHKSLVASQRAYEQQLEQDGIKQAAKKRKVMGEAAPANLLSSVLEICYQHSLHDHLDIADVAWMRTANKCMGGIAARMARDRMKAIRLSCTTYSPARGFACYEINNPPHLPLYHDTTDTDLHLLPEHYQLLIPWSFRSATNDPSNVKIKVFLDREQYTGIPERGILFRSSDHLEVARYLIESRLFREEGEIRKARSNVQLAQGDMEGSLKYEVASCALNSTLFGEEQSFGSIVFRSVAFTFNDFLGIYLRMKLHSVKQKYNSSQVKNPADKVYIKALAKAAREAPGNADSFELMEGWENIYRA